MMASADADDYFKAVDDGDLQKLKEILAEKRVKLDAINKVWQQVHLISCVFKNVGDRMVIKLFTLPLEEDTLK